MKAKQWGGATVSIKKLIRKYGREYTQAVLPPDIPRGPVGKCFDYCALQAAIFSKNLQDGKYSYVEGIATDPETGRWVLHAWLTDGAYAFDPTWASFENHSGKELPMPCQYIGIRMPIKDVAHFMRKTTYQGLLGNRWRDPELVDTILERTKSYRA